MRSSMYMYMYKTYNNIVAQLRYFCDLNKLLVCVWRYRLSFEYLSLPLYIYGYRIYTIHIDCYKSRRLERSF